MISAQSFEKRPLKLPNLKPLRLFFSPFAWARKGVSVKMHNIEREICFRTIKHAVCRRVCVHFSARKLNWLGSEGVTLNTKQALMLAWKRSKCEAFINIYISNIFFFFSFRFKPELLGAVVMWIRSEENKMPGCWRSIDFLSHIPASWSWRHRYRLPVTKWRRSRPCIHDLIKIFLFNFILYVLFFPF